MKIVIEFTNKERGAWFFALAKGQIEKIDNPLFGEDLEIFMNCLRSAKTINTDIPEDTMRKLRMNGTLI